MNEKQKKVIAYYMSEPVNFDGIHGIMGLSALINEMYCTENRQCCIYRVFRPNGSITEKWHKHEDDDYSSTEPTILPFYIHEKIAELDSTQLPMIDEAFKVFEDRWHYRPGSFWIDYLPKDVRLAVQSAIELNMGLLGIQKNLDWILDTI